MKALRGKIAVPLVAKARRWQTRILFPPPLCVRWTFKKERDRVEQDAKMTKYRSKKEWNNVKTKHCGKIPGRLLRTRTMYKDIGDPEKWEFTWQMGWKGESTAVSLQRTTRSTMGWRRSGGGRGIIRQMATKNNLFLCHSSLCLPMTTALDDRGEKKNSVIPPRTWPRDNGGVLIQSHGPWSSRSRILTHAT